MKPPRSSDNWAPTRAYPDADRLDDAEEPESGRGHAVTAGGSLLPMSEVIRQAAAAHHYLAVFDNHAECPLYLGRSGRLASAAQRIVLYAKDRGCTRPGRTEPAYHSEAITTTAGPPRDSPTDIDRLSLACGPDNRLIEETGWTTRKRKDAAALRGLTAGCGV